MFRSHYGENFDDLTDFITRTAKEYPLLTAAQEVALMKRYESGDERAKEIMICSNLRLVNSIAVRYPLFSTISRFELFQEGVTGLIRAVELFDWRRGFKFSTYATWWIRQRISRMIANDAVPIRIPVSVGQLRNNMMRLEQEYIYTLGRKPTDEELAELLGVTMVEMERVRGAGKVVASLDAPVSRDPGAHTLAEVLDRPEPEREDTSYVREAVKRLPEPQRTVVELRHGLADESVPPMPTKRLARHIGMGEHRVLEYENDALDRLRVLIENL